MTRTQMTQGDFLKPLRAGTREARLAATDTEIQEAQRLRFRVFFEEMGAKPSDAVAMERRDFDDFDRHCDHLLVLDHVNDKPRVIGTYRLMRREQAAQIGRFYTQAEYDIGKILAHSGPILELGRSCVAPDYRDRPTMQLLWRAIAAYVFRYRIDLMFGCASIPGTDPDALALALSYLHRRHLAPEDLRPRALPARFIGMDRMAADKIDSRAALATLPPLVKGYLRLGGFVGDGAVIDREFNATDVCILVKTDLVTEKYFRHYERTALGQNI